MTTSTSFQKQKTLRDIGLSVGRRLQHRDSSWFEAQIRSRARGRIRKLSNGEIQILCPFHADSNLGSFSVNVLKGGGWSCFSCNAQRDGGGGWNRLAEKMGMEKLEVLQESDSSLGDHALSAVGRALNRAGFQRERLADKQIGEAAARPQTKPWPVDRRWRGISGQTLKDLGCLRVLDLKNNCERIGLPVRSAEGQLQGYTCRALSDKDLKDPKLRYVMLSPNAQRERALPAHKAIFLLDQATAAEWDSFALVEGPYDALKLVEAGVPALSILGVANWNPGKIASLVALNPKKIVVLMDADKAGKAAARRITSDLKSAGLPAIKVGLPKGVKDPGKLDQNSIDELADLLNR